MAPGIPDALNESNLTIGPKALKDMIEHFPLARGAKSDPQLIWSFGESEVELRSLESSVDTRGVNAPSHMTCSRANACRLRQGPVGHGTDDQCRGI